MSGQDSSSWRSLLVWGVFAVVLVALPLVFASGGAISMMSLMGVMIVFALSYNMLLGQTGMLSFGHAVYYGLAGFVTIHAMNLIWHGKYPVPLVAVPLVGGLAGLFFGALFGFVTTRRSGTVFAMITLGIGELVAASSLILRTFFGGEAGISTNRTKMLPLFGHKFGPAIEVYYLIAAWCFVAVVLMYAITRTPFGRMCNAVRENPERVEFIGYSAQRIRFLAFVLSSFFAGIAGALGTINFEIMNAVSLGAQESGTVLLMSFIGGIGLFWGPIVGAVLVTFLQVTLSDLTGAWMLYFGILFMLVVLFAPGGIAGWLAMHWPALRHGQIRRLVPPYLLALVPLAMLLAGGILLIQLAHHMLVDASSQGPELAVFYIPMRGDAALPWIVAAALLLLGGVVLRLVWPRVQAAWGAVNKAILADGEQELA